MKDYVQGKETLDSDEEIEREIELERQQEQLQEVGY